MSNTCFNRILVINIAGNYGATVTDKLQENLHDSVLALCDNTPERTNHKLIIDTDLLNPAELYECIAIYDIVIIVYLPSEHVFTKQNITDDTNTIRDIVNCCLESNIKKLVFLGSVLSLGVRKDFEVLDENCIYAHNKFQNNQSLSAFCCEQEVWRAGAEGMNVIILNVPVIWHDLESDLFRIHFVEPIMKNFHNAAGAFGFVALSDVMGWLVRVVKEDFVNERFILSAENLSFSELIRLLKLYHPESTVRESLLLRLKKWITDYKFWISKQNFYATSVAISFKNFTIKFDNSKSLKISGSSYKRLKDFIVSTKS